MADVSGVVVGYLRQYRRWNGQPGLTLAEQRRLVNEIALEFGYEPTKRYLTDLHRAIQLAIDNEELSVLVVIPTLDGVQYNLSFLNTLVYAAKNEAPVYVRSGWRRPKFFSPNTNYKYRPEKPAWLLSLSDQAEDFMQMVKRVSERSRALRDSVGPALRTASANGAKIGARHPTAHRFTLSEQRKGGRRTAEIRRLKADEPYQKLIPLICTWRREGASLGQIAARLAAKGIVKPDGRRIGPMLVYRILKRALP